MHHLISPLSLRTGFLLNWVSEWVTYYNNFYFLNFRINLLLYYYFNSAFFRNRIHKFGFMKNQIKYFLPDTYKTHTILAVFYKRRFTFYKKLSFINKKYLRRKKKKVKFLKTKILKWFHKKKNLKIIKRIFFIKKKITIKKCKFANIYKYLKYIVSNYLFYKRKKIIWYLLKKYSFKKFAKKIYYHKRNKFLMYKHLKRLRKRCRKYKLWHEKKPKLSFKLLVPLWTEQQKIELESSSLFIYKKKLFFIKKRNERRKRRLKLLGTKIKKYNKRNKKYRRNKRYNNKYNKKFSKFNKKKWKPFIQMQPNKKIKKLRKKKKKKIKKKKKKRFFFYKNKTRKFKLKVLKKYLLLLNYNKFRLKEFKKKKFKRIYKLLSKIEKKHLLVNALLIKTKKLNYFINETDQNTVFPNTVKYIFIKKLFNLYKKLNNFKYLKFIKKKKRRYFNCTKISLQTPSFSNLKHFRNRYNKYFNVYLKNKVLIFFRNKKNIFKYSKLIILLKKKLKKKTFKHFVNYFFNSQKYIHIQSYTLLRIFAKKFLRYLKKKNLKKKFINNKLKKKKKRCIKRRIQSKKNITYKFYRWYWVKIKYHYKRIFFRRYGLKKKKEKKDKSYFKVGLLSKNKKYILIALFPWRKKYIWWTNHLYRVIKTRYGKRRLIFYKRRKKYRKRWVLARRLNREWRWEQYKKTLRRKRIWKIVRAKHIMLFRILNINFAKTNFAFNTNMYVLNTQMKSILHRLYYKKCKYYKKLLKNFYFNFIVQKDLKMLYLKCLQLYNCKISILVYIIRFNASLSACQVTEEIKVLLLCNKRIAHLMEYLKAKFKKRMRKNILKGYKVIIKGRPHRMARSRKFRVQGGLLEPNKFSSQIDYDFMYVRMKYGICGIKVWLNLI